MINPTTLRIGNHVSCQGKEYTVKAIEHNPVTDKYYIKVFESFIQMLCDHLEPIELTEERLVELGFVKTHLLYRFTLQHGYDSDFIKYDLDDNMLSLHDSWINKFPYVHELQNIYHSLTNQELKPIK